MLLAADVIGLLGALLLAIPGAFLALFITHTAREAGVQATLRDLRELDVVDNVVSLMRVIE